MNSVKKGTIGFNRRVVSKGKRSTLSAKQQNISESTHSLITNAVAKRVARLNSSEWIQVVPRNKSWVVRKNGAQRAIGIFPDKSTALSTAKRLKSKSALARIIIYDVNGQVSQILS